MGMKRVFAAILSVILLAPAISGCSVGGGEPGISSIDWENREMRAEQFVAALANGDYTIAAQGFDAEMSRALGVRGLKKAWEDSLKVAGSLISVYETQNVPNDEYDIYLVLSRHENRALSSRVVFSKDGLIAGLFFSFIDIAEDWDAAPVANDGYTEYPVIIAEGGDYPLRGILSIPDGAAAPLPAVVLVHGSGPSDMDETVFGVTVFKDISDYLAKNGMAVLRYDKRTYSHGAKLAEQYGDGLTVREETIDDALLAKSLLMRDERIDPYKIFVLGHSLGGMLAPRIVSEGDFAGGIIMAGSPRSLLDVVYDQNMYFIELMDLGDDERSALYEQVEQAREEFFSLPQGYIMEMDAHPAESYLLETNKPFLIMQGGKDFQVYPDVDFALYREIARGRGNIALRLYDGLTHLFTRSTMDTPTTDDYVAGSHVDPGPLADIVDWLTKQG